MDVHFPQTTMDPASLPNTEVQAAHWASQCSYAERQMQSDLTKHAPRVFIPFLYNSPHFSLLVVEFICPNRNSFKWLTWGKTRPSKILNLLLLLFRACSSKKNLLKERMWLSCLSSSYLSVAFIISNLHHSPHNTCGFLIFEISKLWHNMAL